MSDRQLNFQIRYLLSRGYGPTTAILMMDDATRAELMREAQQRESQRKYSATIIRAKKIEDSQNDHWIIEVSYLLVGGILS